MRAVPSWLEGARGPALLVSLVRRLLPADVAPRDRRHLRHVSDRTIAPVIANWPPILLLFTIYALTSLLTELLSNNAVAVVVTPVAIGLAQTLGLDPRPVLILVMLGASFGFATPIGYQCNLLVYGPGGYRFSDFLRIGIPLNLLCGVVACLVIPLFYDL